MAMTPSCVGCTMGLPEPHEDEFCEQCADGTLSDEQNSWVCQQCKPLTCASSYTSGCKTADLRADGKLVALIGTASPSDIVQKECKARCKEIFKKCKPKKFKNRKSLVVPGFGVYSKAKACKTAMQKCRKQTCKKPKKPAGLSNKESAAMMSAMMSPKCAAPPHDCKTKEMWPPEKARWCCECQQLGCPDCNQQCAGAKKSVACKACQEGKSVAEWCDAEISQTTSFDMRMPSFNPKCPRSTSGQCSGECTPKTSKCRACEVGLVTKDGRYDANKYCQKVAAGVYKDEGGVCEGWCANDKDCEGKTTQYGTVCDGPNTRSNPPTGTITSATVGSGKYVRVLVRLRPQHLRCPDDR